MPTRVLGELAAGLVVWEVDSDTSDRITALRCINGAGQAAAGEIVQLSNGRRRSLTFPPAATMVLTVPTGPAQRIVQTPLPNGRFDGVEYRLTYPA